MGDREPDLAERLQRAEQDRETRGTIRSLLIALAIMVALGLGFMAAWLTIYLQSWRNLLG